jgi:hypothetical protein
MRDNPALETGGARASSTGSEAASASFNSSRSGPAKSGSAPKIKGVLDEDPASGPRQISGASPEFARAVHNAMGIRDWTDRALRLREIVRGIPVEELPAACENAKKSTRSDSYMVLSALGSRWAESDPRGAAEFAAKFETGDYNSLLSGVMEKWSASAPAEAAAWTEALPPGNARSNAMYNVIYTEARRNPEQALEVLRRQSLSGNGRWYANNLFNEWAGRDPEAAAAAAVQLKGAMADGALQAVARSWGQADPAKAMAWASKVPDLSARKGLIGSIASEWASSDPHAELGWARSLTDVTMRRAAMTNGIASLAGTDVPAALEEIRAMPEGKDRDIAVQAAAQRIAGNDARSAVELLEQLPAGLMKNQSIDRVCSIWGQSEPRAALDWYMQNAGSRAGSGYYWGGIGGTVQGWAASSPDDAIAWAKAQPPGDNRDTALAAIVNGLTATDFDRAQSLFGELSPEGQKSAVYSLANNLFQQDAGKARTWAEALPPGPAQNNAFGVVAAGLANQDPAAAAQWLGTLAPGKSLDSAVANFSQATFDRDPEGSLTWALTISDPKNRDRQTEQLFSRWLSSDSTAARTWLEANQQITPEEKNRILHHD